MGKEKRKEKQKHNLLVVRGWCALIFLLHKHFDEGVVAVDALRW